MEQKSEVRDNRYKRLNFDELRGANWAFRVVHTSPQIRGGALELIEELIAESNDEINHRVKNGQK